MSSKKNEMVVISLGDLVANVDSIVPIPVGENKVIEVRIRKPTAGDELKFAELVSMQMDKWNEAGLSPEELQREDVRLNDPRARTATFEFRYYRDAHRISSCCYFPDRDESGNPVELPRRMFKSAQEVLDGCPAVLFEELAKKLDELNIDNTVAEAAAKK